MIVRELLTKFGVDADDKTLDRWDKGVKKVKLGMAAAAAASVGLVAGLVKITTSASAAGDAIAKQALGLGMTTDEYQEMQYVADRAGASVEALGRSVMRSGKLAADAQRGNKQATDAFRQLGLSGDLAAGKLDDAGVAFDTITERLAGMEDQTAQANIAMQVFGDRMARDVLRVVRQGPEAVRGLREEYRGLGVSMDQQLLRNSERLQDNLGRLRLIFQAVRNTIAARMMPVVNAVVEAFTDWWRANREIIQQGIERWVDRLIDRLLDLWEFALNVRDAFGGWRNILIALVGIKVASWLWGATAGMIGLIKGITTAKASMLMFFKALGLVKAGIMALLTVKGAMIAAAGALGAALGYGIGHAWLGALDRILPDIGERLNRFIDYHAAPIRRLLGREGPMTVAEGRQETAAERQAHIERRVAEGMPRQAAMDEWRAQQRRTAAPRMEPPAYPTMMGLQPAMAMAGAPAGAAPAPVVAPSFSNMFDIDVNVESGADPQRIGQEIGIAVRREMEQAKREAMRTFETREY